jgi:hypothetical protein
MIVTADELLLRGLVLVGFSAARIGNVSRSTNLSRFRSHYGSNPIVYSEIEIWEDLQTLPFPEAKIAIDGVFVELDSFLLALFFMTCYPAEPHLTVTFKVCEKTARKCCWFFAKKIQALKAAKVSLREKRFYSFDGMIRLTSNVNHRLSGLLIGHRVLRTFPNSC